MAPTKQAPKRIPRKVHGTAAGFGYYKCRCKRCKAWNAAYQKEYREKYTARECRVKKCKRQAARSTGNGLCKRHDQMLKARRLKRLEAKLKNPAKTKAKATKNSKKGKGRAKASA